MKENLKEIIWTVFYPSPCLAVLAKCENRFRWKGKNICLYEKSFLSRYKV